MALPVAVQVYSVRDDAKADIRGTLEQIKKMGYDGVEFAQMHGSTPEELKALCEEFGLVPVSAHVPYAALMADLKGTVAQYASIGCQYIAIPYLGEAERPGGENFAQVIENIKMIGKEVRAQGMQLLYHNHDFEFIKMDGKYGLDVLYESTCPQCLQTELDTCWVNVGGENPSEYLMKYAGRSPVVHLKDFYGEKSEDMYELIGIEKKKPVRPSNFEFRPIGSGLQDIPAILKAAEAAGAKWLVVEQDNPSMGLTPMECIAKSKEYLSTLGY